MVKSLDTKQSYLYVLAIHHEGFPQDGKAQLWGFVPIHQEEH